MIKHNLKVFVVSIEMLGKLKKKQKTENNSSAAPTRQHRSNCLENQSEVKYD